MISRTTKIILIVEFLVLSYMMYVLSTSLYKSYQVDRFIANAEKENEKLQQENEKLIEDYEYYSSAGYKEKIAKQNFGLVRAGEEVIILTGDDSSGGALATNVIQPAKENYYKSLSNPKKWFLLFFDRDGAAK